ncbi:MAG: NAD-dependent epimerase/dehydratase family protein [Pirellulales bacterium]
MEVFGTDYPTPDGTCARDYIHVDDLAEAHLLALERLEPGQGRAYNLGIGTGYSVREVLAACEEVTGRRIPVQFGPRRSGDPPALVASAEGRGASWAGSPGIPTCERSWKRRGVGTGSTRGATTAEADAAVNGRRLRARGKGRFGHWEDSDLPRWPLSEQGGADPVIKAPDGAPGCAYGTRGLLGPQQALGTCFATSGLSVICQQVPTSETLMSVQAIPYSPKASPSVLVEKPQYFLPKAPPRDLEQVPAADPDGLEAEDFRARWWPGADISEE